MRDLRGFLAPKPDSKAEDEGEEAQEDDEDDEEEGAPAVAVVGAVGRDESVKSLSGCWSWQLN